MLALNPGRARRIAACVSALGLAVAQHVSAQGDAGRSEALIRQLRQTSNAAIARHDTAGIAAILAPNVVVVASTSAVAVGPTPTRRVSPSSSARAQMLCIAARRAR